jgi:hypothetical protein
MVEAHTVKPEGTSYTKKERVRMNCQDLRKFLSAYLDDELEVAGILRLEDHLTE